MAYFAIVAVLFLFQRQMLYFPTNFDPKPADVALNGVHVVELTTPDDETLILWHTAAPKGQPTVLFLQGNGGEIGDRARRFQAYRDAGFGVAFLSYRGYGGSTGIPTETGLVTDAHAAYEWLLSQGVSPAKVMVIGESLGTGVAVQLAAQRDVGMLLLSAPYTAIVDIAQQRYPWIPVRFLMKDKFQSINYITDVTAPILIQHGTDDRLVPFALGQELASVAGDSVTFIPVEGAGHELIFMPRTYQLEIQFISENLAS